MNKPARRIATRPAQAGVSLVELIMFIVLVALAVGAIMNVFFDTLRGSPSPSQITQATRLAQERMELILSRKNTLRFTNFTDPCPGSPSAPACAKPALFSVTASTSTWPTDSGTYYKLITVTVTSDPTGQKVAELKSVVSRY